MRLIILNITKNFKRLVPVGIELTTFALLARRSNQLSYETSAYLGQNKSIEVQYNF